MGEDGSKIVVYTFFDISFLHSTVSRSIKKKSGLDHNPTNEPIFGFESKEGGYGEIGRRYGLDWIEPWYGNLLSDNFQIQRNPGMKNGQS